jgi:hypothetical protein
VRVWASALGELEYVFADAAQNVIAVVRRVPGRPQVAVPHWVDARSCVVVGPDGAAALVIERGLVITRADKPRIVGRANAKYLADANALIGMVGRGGTGERLIFRDCTCGRRRKCVCGARKGAVLNWSTMDLGAACPVVDDEQHELGRITLRMSSISREDTGTGATRAMLARSVRAARTSLARGPMRFELVGAGPGFDWRRHGLFVALAVLCDGHALNRVFPSGGA